MGHDENNQTPPLRPPQRTVRSDWIIPVLIASGILIGFGLLFIIAASDMAPESVGPGDHSGKSSPPSTRESCGATGAEALLLLGLVALRRGRRA